MNSKKGKEATLMSFWEEIFSVGVQEMVSRLTDEEAKELTERYGAHNYHPLPVNIVRARGVYAYDGKGKEYIDCIGSYSAVSHGHLSEFIVSSVMKQLEKVTLVSRALYTSELALFLKTICEYCDMDMCCPMNTGVEAIETCIKLARKWAYTVKGVKEDRAEIIVAEGNFHGRTTTVIGFSTEPQYRYGFGPFTPGFKIVPFGDAEAIEKAINENTAAVLLEPIQAEAGIIIPPEGYMEKVRNLCSKNNVLLIWDEVQTGLCRTGKKFAWMYENAKPDLMAVGKALGGGILPISAALGKKEIMEVFKPGDHGSTFGGNPLACAVAIAGMAELEVSNAAEKSARLGNRLLQGFRKIRSDSIEDVRGKGLLIGLQVKERVDTELLVQQFIQEGILTKETRQRTFRFAPPFVVNDVIVDEIVARVERALKKIGEG
ncbi:MAG TPA: ornithine--oxo-acid transaminase [Fimbriimonadales bacterium]|nr:ornithine--oxo-acid transaminase [Fimbriimonadales bacterium]